MENSFLMCTATKRVLSMTSAKDRHDKDKPTVIKKYANRRLYDTGRSSYVTLEDLCIMVKEGRDFVVYDAKTGEDLTRSVLTQIIVEQESRGGQNLLPINFLRQLIGFYGDNLQSVIPGYLEQTLGMFSKNQEQFRSQINKSLEGMGMGSMMNPVGAMEEISRKNMEMFENAMRAWSPFTMGGTAAGGKDKEEQIRQLKKTIAEMEKELSRLSGQR